MVRSPAARNRSRSPALSRLRAGCIALLLAAAPAVADEISDALAASEQALKAARESQARVNRLDDEAKALQKRRHELEWKLQQQIAYAEQLETQADEQEKVRDEIEMQLSRVGHTGQELQPLMQRMVEELEAFVAADLPFFLQRRQERVATLKSLLDDGTRTPAEKYRRVMDAYRSEVDYGRTLGVEESEITVGGSSRPATLVHVGRVGLYALTPDGEPFVWRRGTGEWERLDPDLADNVRVALDVAAGQAPPELLVLPVPVPRAEAGTGDSP